MICKNECPKNNNGICSLTNKPIEINSRCLVEREYEKWWSDKYLKTETEK